MTPEQVLAAAINPLQEAASTYGGQQVDLARLQLANAMQQQGRKAQLTQEQANATALLSQRLAGEKDLQLSVEKERQNREDIRQQTVLDREDMRQKAMDDRQEKQLKAYVDRLTEQQKQAEITRSTRAIAALHGTIPQRDQKDTTDGYLNKLLSEESRAQDERTKVIAGNLGRIDQQISDIHNNNEGARAAAQNNAPAMFLDNLRKTGDSAVVDDFLNGTNLSKKNPKKQQVGFAQAVQAAGLGSAFGTFADNLTKTYRNTRMGMSSDDLTRIDALERARRGIATPEAEAELAKGILTPTTPRPLAAAGSDPDAAFASIALGATPRTPATTAAGTGQTNAAGGSGPGFVVPRAGAPVTLTGELPQMVRALPNGQPVLVPNPAYLAQQASKRRQVLEAKLAAGYLPANESPELDRLRAMSTAADSDNTLIIGGVPMRPPGNLLAPRPVAYNPWPMQQEDADATAVLSGGQ